MSIWQLLKKTTIYSAIFLAIVGCSKTETKEKSINISGNIPLTGPIAAFSGQYGKGFQMGIEEACKSYGLEPSKFNTDFQDNAGSPATAVTVFQKQLISGENPALYISGTSAMSDAIIPQLNTRHVPHALVAFDAFMTGKNPNTFRVLPNFKLEAPLFIKFIKGNNAKKVFFFTPNLKAYLEQSDELILPEIKAGKIDYQRELFEFGQKDYRSLVAKAEQYKPDVIVISGYSFHVYPIIKHLKESGLAGQARIICTLDYIDLLHSERSANQELNDIAFTSPECEIPGKNPNYAKWIETFVSKYGKTPSYVDAYAYDTASMVVLASKKSGTISIESIKAITPYQGITGSITLDKTNDLSSTLTIGYRDKEGKVSAWTE